MKFEKIKSFLKRIGECLIIFIILLIVVSFFIDDNGNVSPSKEAIIENVDKKDLKTIEKVSEEKSTSKPEKEQNEKIGKTFTINHKTEFDGYSTPFLTL